MKQAKLSTTFIKYVSLNVMGMIGLSCYILADTFFVSQGMGANGLTALNLAIPIYSLINATGLMIGMGGSTRYSILKAKSNHNSANKIFNHALLFGIIIGLILTLSGIIFSENLSTLLGADESTFTMTNVYLKTLLFFSPFFIVNNILVGFVRNDNAPKLAMCAMLAASFSNIILDYIFIFPCNMGIFGAALATGIAPIISMCLLSLHFIKKRNTFTFAKCKLKLKILGEITALGISSFITEISSGIVMIIFNIVILGIAGNIGVAAYGIIANLSLVVVSIFVGIAQGIQPILSTNFGKGNIGNVKKIYKYSIVTAIALAILVYIFMMLYPKELISVFNSENNSQLAELALQGLPIYFFAFFFTGFNIISSSALSSVELPKQAFIISVLRGCSIIIPSVLILSNILNIQGVWMSYPLTEILTALAVFVINHSLKNKGLTHFF